MSIHILIYIIAAITLFLLAYILFRYYNNGMGIRHSFCKVCALCFAVLTTISGIVLVNLSFKHTWSECFIEIFNNLTCTFLGVVIAFIFKNNLLNIKKAKPFNEDS